MSDPSSADMADVATITVCVLLPPFLSAAEAEAAAPAASSPVGDGDDDDLDLVGRIQSFRRPHDRAVSRWPPHLTVLPPTTLPVDLITPAELHGILQPVVASMPQPSSPDALQLLLDRVAVFKHKSSSTIVLEPDENAAGTRLLKDLQPRLAAAVESFLASKRPGVGATGALMDDEAKGDHDGNEDDGDAHPSFRPHLTLANPVKGVRNVESIVARIKKSFFGNGSFDAGSHSFVMDRLCVMVKGHGKGSFYQRVPDLDLVFPRPAPLSDLLDSIPLRLEKGSSSRTYSATTLSPMASSETALWEMPFTFDEVSQSWIRLSNVDSRGSSASLAGPTILTYNILTDGNDPTNYDEVGRYHRIANELESAGPDIIALQEVSPAFVRFIQSQPWIKKSYYLSQSISMANSSNSLMTISKHAFRFYQLKKAGKGSGSPRPPLVCHFQSMDLVAVVVHLISDYSRDRSSDRAMEWSRIAAASFPTDRILVLGDFNAADSETAFSRDALASVGFADAWRDMLAADAEAPAIPPLTFDPVRNPLAAAVWDSQGKNDGRPGKRLDRVLVKGKFAADGVQVAGCALFGEPVQDELENGDWNVGSDHFGILCQLLLNGGKPGPVLDAPSQSVSPLIPPSPELDQSAGPALYDFLVANRSVPSSDAHRLRLDAFLHLKHVLTVIFGASPIRFEPIGSFALGTYSTNSDLDILCAGLLSPVRFFALVSGEDYDSDLEKEEEDDGEGDDTASAEPATSLKNHPTIELIRIVQDAKIPLVELRIFNVSVQLQYCYLPLPVPDNPSITIDSFIFSTSAPSSSPQPFLPPATLSALSARADVLGILKSLTAIKDGLSQYRLAARLLRLWASRRGLSVPSGDSVGASGSGSSAKVGLVCTHALSLLLARAMAGLDSGEATISDGPTAAAAFFRFCAEFQWEKDPCVVDVAGIVVGGTAGALVPVVDARNPMVVVSSALKRVNVTRAVTLSAREVWRNEVLRAAEIVREGGAWWEKICEEFNFTETFESCIRIDLQATSETKLNNLIARCELRIPSLFGTLERRCPHIRARFWPQLLVESDDSEDSAAVYIIGLSRRQDTESKQESAVDLKNAFQETLINFSADISTNWEGYTDSAMWVHVAHVSSAGLKSLHPRPARTVLPRLEAASGASRPRHTAPALETSDEKDEGGRTGESGSDGTKLSSKPKGKGKKKAADASRGKRSGPTEKLRTSQDVFDRIMWDPQFDAEDWIVGYEDRFTGIQEMRVSDFAKNRADTNNEDWIPFHRVWYFKHQGVKKWDRKSRVDAVFGSGAAPPPPPPPPTAPTAAAAGAAATPPMPAN
ncbi:hypothetical protein DFJ73DRAFT_960935 [Zopfochytrium polystomum]|nr:hypothetical protein DFJ73DRAFT_960935 [Zopfochytrium polystomum]